MKFFVLFLSSFSAFFAQAPFDSEEALRTFISDAETFYAEFVAEQEVIDSSVGLGSLSSGFVPPSNPYSPPSDPPAPTPQNGFLPVVIVNNSGFPDASVYISVIGTQLTGTSPGAKMYMTFDSAGSGSYTLVSSGSGNVPVIQLSSLNTTPLAPNTYVIYIPANQGSSQGISGGRIYFQINSNQTLITYNGGVLTEPSVLNQSLTPYGLTFDKFEVAYVPAGNPQVNADATAADFFSVPLYGFLSTPDTGSPSHSGIYQPQSFIMKTVAPSFFNGRCRGSYRSAILAQWNNLFSPNQANPIRILSPGSAMSVGTGSSFPNSFDPNYFDNATAYGFSLLQYIWYGSDSYYRSQGLYFQTPASNLYPQPGICSANGVSGVYTATIASDNMMNFCPNFTTEAQSYFPAPSTANASAPSPTNGPTSYLIFASQNLNSSFAANLQGNQVSKLFEEAMVAGLLPAPFSPSNPLSNTYLSNNVQGYFGNASALPASAGGPWYDVYSEAIHYCGSIYTFGFDEPLYPNVLMQCTTPSPSTYIGITIGPCDLVP